MSLSTATISYDISDMVGSDFTDLRRTKVWVTTDVPGETVIDTVGNAIRVGDGVGSLATDGTGSVVVWVPGTGSNPASWQTYIHFHYPKRAVGAKNEVRTFGPFTITADANLADLVEEQEVPPEYLTTVTTLLDAKVTAAQAAQTAAEAARDSAVDISGIATPDALVADLVSDPVAGPLTTSALSASYVAQNVSRTGAQAASALTINDTGATGKVTVALNDNATHDKSILQIQHVAAVAGAYGLNILNGDGARSAVCIHQYSVLEPAIQIDNTDNHVAISINNTHNFTNNPDGPSPNGQGPFIRFQNDFVTKLQLRYDYVFESFGVTPVFYTNDPASKALSVQTDSLVETTTLEVIKAGTGAGKAMFIQNAGTGQALSIAQNGASQALSIAQSGANSAAIISANAGAAGFYVVVMAGQNYGPKITTSTNSGETLRVEKNGTGAGTAVVWKNAGTGLTLDVQDGSGSRFAITAAGLPKWVAAANVQTTVGAAGAASALPATPSKYLKVVGDDGTTYVVPAYAAA